MHHGHHHDHGHHSPEKIKEPLNLPYTQPSADQLYRVATVKDISKGFTIETNGQHHLRLDEFKGLDNQLFHVEHHNGKYSLISLFNKSALHVAHDGNNDGASITSSHHQHTSSFFQLVPITQSVWAGKACSLITASGKALDIKGNVLTNGTEIVQWTGNHQDNQQWLVIPVEAKKEEVHVGFQPVFGKTYRISPVGASGKCLDISKNQASLNNVILWDWHGGLNQQFTFEHDHDKYHIKSAESNNYLGVHHDTDKDGVQIKVDAPGKKSQIWEVVPTTELKYAGKGYFHIKTFCGKSIDVPGFNYTNDAHINQWTFNGGDNQTWIITPN